MERNVVKVVGGGCEWRNPPSDAIPEGNDSVQRRVQARYGLLRDSENRDDCVYPSIGNSGKILNGELCTVEVR